MISYLDIFFHADFIGQLVLSLLLLSSLYVWGIILSKMIYFLRLYNAVSSFKIYVFHRTQVKRLNVEENTMNFQLYEALFNIYSDAYGDKSKDNLDRLKNYIAKQWEQKLEKDLDYLSIIGSITPFIGLFGTVWGIMNSFQSIAHAKSTSIAIVAPGISEALFATAIGLFVAIPASVATHLFYSKIEWFLKDFDIFADKLIEKFESLK